MPDPQPLTAPDCRADLDISEVHHLGGPNRWTYRPVLEAVVDIGMLEDFPSNRIPGFAERLANWLPGLIEHRCSPGVRGGFLHRLREGTWPAHILEHVTLELQTLEGQRDVARIRLPRTLPAEAAAPAPMTMRR